MSTGSPLVSIGLPAYKSKFLSEAIQSVLSQSYKNFELIIVNDKSPEDIGAVVSQFSDERIHYYVNEHNLGLANPAHNWNKCLSYARGEFYAMLCDDDLYETGFIERMLTLAEKYPQTSVFRARANFIDASGKEINRYASSPEWETWEDYLWHVCHDYRSQTISEWFYRKAALDAAHGYALLPMAWYADYLSVFRFAQKGGIASTYEILVHFRLSGDNISSQDDKNTIKKIEAANTYRNAVEEMLQECPDHDTIMESLDRLLRLQKKAILNHAPRKVLLQLFMVRKQYGVPVKRIWSAFWHKKK